MRPQRLEVRLTDRERLLLERGAEATGETLSEFVRAAAYERAAEIHRDQTTIVLSADAADEFLKMLDGPVNEESVEGLRELHRRAQRFNQA